MKHLKHIFENKKIDVPEHIWDEIMDMGYDIIDNEFRLFVKGPDNFIGGNKTDFTYPYISVFKIGPDGFMIDFTFTEVEMIIKRIVSYLKGEGYATEIKHVPSKIGGYIDYVEGHENTPSRTFRIDIVNNID